jgi:signal transduction histidine kinase
MSLKYKVGLVVSLLFVLSGLASIAVNQLLIMPSFEVLERQAGERNTSRAAEAINRDLEVLSTNVTAWAQWDDSKAFMLGENDSFVESELSAEAVASAEVSYMGFYRKSGAQVIYRAPAAAHLGSRGLGAFERSLPSDHPLLQHSDERSDARGLVATPSGPMLAASRPIVSSSGEGPAAGVLIFGRLLDATTVAQIAERHKLDLSIGPVSRADESKAGAPPTWLPGTNYSPQQAIRFSESEEILLGETTILDVHRAPILNLRVATARVITAQGEEATRFALTTLSAVALAVLGTLLGVIHVMVLGPIARMTAHAVELGRTDALNKRLALEREDELGVLASEFDRMTDHLAEARQRLIDQSFISGKTGMAAGILHNIGNTVTPLTVRLNTLSDRIKSAPGDDIERAVAELESGKGTSERRSDLARFVNLAALELAGLIRDAHEQVSGAVAQVEHVQQILSAQERISRAGATPAEAVEIEPIVRQVAGSLSPALLRIVSVEIDPSVRATGPVRGNRVEIQQIVGNLVLNAAESIKGHCISSGRIRVRAEIEEGEPPVAHFSFDDNGGGITAKDLASMFHRGFSTKQRGTGLGLHWSATAVAAMGGKLYAESAGPGQGATLHLLLPLAGEARRDAPEGSARERVA